MAYPKSKKVVAGDTILAKEYNDLRDDTFNTSICEFTFGETINQGQAVYLKSSDGKVYKAIATDNDEKLNNFIGIALENGNNGEKKQVQIGGVVENLSGLTTGSYYLINTYGAYDKEAGDYEYKIGFALNDKCLLLLKENKSIVSGSVSINVQGDDVNIVLPFYPRVMFGIMSFSGGNYFAGASFGIATKNKSQSIFSNTSGGVSGNFLSETSQGVSPSRTIYVSVVSWGTTISLRARTSSPAHSYPSVVSVGYIILN